VVRADAQRRQRRGQRPVSHQPEKEIGPGEAEYEREYGDEDAVEGPPDQGVQMGERLVADDRIGGHAAEDVRGPERILTGLLLVFDDRLRGGAELLDVVGHKLLSAEIDFTEEERGDDQQEDQDDEVLVLQRDLFPEVGQCRPLRAALCVLSGMLFSGRVFRAVFLPCPVL
jgi:hypothetical protein